MRKKGKQFIFGCSLVLFASFSPAVSADSLSTPLSDQTTDKYRTVLSGDASYKGIQQNTETVIEKTVFSDWVDDQESEQRSDLSQASESTSTIEEFLVSEWQTSNTKTTEWKNSESTQTSEWVDFVNPNLDNHSVVYSTSSSNGDGFVAEWQYSNVTASSATTDVRGSAWIDDNNSSEISFDYSSAHASSSAQESEIRSEWVSSQNVPVSEWVMDNTETSAEASASVSASTSESGFDINSEWATSNVAPWESTSQYFTHSNSSEASTDHSNSVSDHAIFEWHWPLSGGTSETTSGSISVSEAASEGSESQTQTSASASTSELENTVSMTMSETSSQSNGHSDVSSTSETGQIGPVQADKSSQNDSSVSEAVRNITSDNETVETPSVIVTEISDGVFEVRLASPSKKGLNLPSIFSISFFNKLFSDLFSSKSSLSSVLNRTGVNDNGKLALSIPTDAKEVVFTYETKEHKMVTIEATRDGNGEWSTASDLLTADSNGELVLDIKKLPRDVEISTDAKNSSGRSVQSVSYSILKIPEIPAIRMVKNELILKPEANSEAIDLAYRLVSGEEEHLHMKKDAKGNWHADAKGVFVAQKTGIIYFYPKILKDLDTVTMSTVSENGQPSRKVTARWNGETFTTIPANEETESAYQLVADH